VISTFCKLMLAMATVARPQALSIARGKVKRRPGWSMRGYG
jgi:hypothetical protein